MRRAVISDLEKVMHIVQQVVAHMGTQGIDQWDDIYPDNAILKTDIQNHHMYVIEHEHAVAGFITLNQEHSPEYDGIPWAFSGNALVVHRLTVAPRFQRRGCASRAMAFAEEYASAGGYHCIRLDVFTKNPGALSLYERRGYQRAGTVRFRKGDFFCYEKNISSGKRTSQI